MARWRRGTTFQSLSFDKDQWTASEARQWASVNGFRASRTKDGGRTIDIEQHDPREFRRTTFRTVQLDDGVQAVVAVPVEPLPSDSDQTFGEALKELRSEIAANKAYVQSEWRRQRKSVSDKVSRVRRARSSGPDPIGDFFKWAKKKMR